MKTKCCKADVHTQNDSMFCSNCIRLISKDDIKQNKGCMHIIVLFLIATFSFAHAYAPTKYVHSIVIPNNVEVTEANYAIDHLQVAVIESNNKSKAVSVKGAFGNMQLMNVTIEDWNKMHPNEKYSLKQALNENVNVKIGKWMLEKRIPQILESKEVPLTINHILISYNWGAGNLVKWYNKGSKYSDLPEETKQYICKYWAKF